MGMDKELAKQLNARMVEIFGGVQEIEAEALRHSSASSLSITEIHTLDAVGTGMARTMTQVASILRISVSTLTIAIARLEKKGYIRRFRVEEDRRIVKVELTEAGRAAVTEHENFHLEMVENAVADLSEEEQAILLQSLTSIREFVQRQISRR